MLPLTLAASVFLVIFCSVCFYGYRRYARVSRFYRHVGAEETSATPLIGADAPGPGRSSPFHLFETVGQALPVSPQDISVARRYLIVAGFRRLEAVQVYYGTKIAAAVLLFLLMLFSQRYLTILPTFRVVLVISGALAGYFLPTIVLERLVKRRQEQMRLALPDALDLLVVCVEAGLGLDQAILNVSQRLARSHRAISEELSLVTLEMRAGSTRADALRSFANRVADPSFRELASILIQADRFGTSVADALRVHADYLRVKRRQDAEERANKVGVKLVFPIFFFIMPAMIIVTSGPAILRFMKELGPAMRNAGQ
jgi:tight adherence protein C